MKSGEFMATLPAAVQVLLAPEITLRRGRLWPWGVQVYDDDPHYHYEVSRVAPRLGDRLELGLHFESRSPSDNCRLLGGFQARLVEIKHELGDSVEAELWDRGWTKVYDTMPLEPYESAYLDTVARRLADMVHVMHPIYRTMLAQKRA
jgi:hypothetical protein